MRKLFTVLIVILIVVLLLVIGILGHRRLVMGPATGLAQGGALGGCPSTPNCVSTHAEGEQHRVEPLALEGDAVAAMAKLRRIVEQMPRTRIVDATESYLHAEASSLIWRYIDDLEIHIDQAAGKIHLRSASRTGYSDLGVNRERVETLTEAYRAGP
ncbi:MAG: DUF1499 domain-containing protein [Acidobacteriota bacterium]